MKVTYLQTCATEAKDVWIQSYKAYLEGEHRRLNGGPIASHYLRCLEATYHAFQRSGSQTHRFQAWVAIKATCEWLAQLGEGAQ